MGIEIKSILTLALTACLNLSTVQAQQEINDSAEIMHIVSGRCFGVGADNFEPCDPLTYSEYGTIITFNPDGTMWFDYFDFNGFMVYSHYLETGTYKIHGSHLIFRLRRVRYKVQQLVVDTTGPARQVVYTDSTWQKDTTVTVTFSRCANGRIQMHTTYFMQKCGKQFPVRYPDEYAFTDKKTNEQISLDFDTNLCWYWNSKNVKMRCKVLSSSQVNGARRLVIQIPGDAQKYMLEIAANRQTVVVKTMGQSAVQLFEQVSKPTTCKKSWVE